MMGTVTTTPFSTIYDSFLTRVTSDMYMELTELDTPKVWFQNFEDTDEFGNTVIREYLCAEGYIWTGQFEEAKRVLDNHNPQSMELDNESVQGHWATDNNSGLEFFIINDAVISKLCILGEDVEPCFEGASFLPSEFAKNTFMKDLLTMVEQLKFALENANNEGGISMNE